MKKIVLVVSLMALAVSSFGIQFGIALNGNMQDGESYVGIVARDFFGMGGLGLGIMPKLENGIDFTSYRIVVSPSLGWGTPELRAYVAMMPHLEIHQGTFDFDVTKWKVGGGANFMVAPHFYGFFEFFVGMDFQHEGFFPGSSYLTVGVCYKIDFGRGF